jgi:hypothetical protein
VLRIFREGITREKLENSYWKIKEDQPHGWAFLLYKVTDELKYKFVCVDAF